MKRKIKKNKKKTGGLPNFDDQQNIYWFKNKKGEPTDRQTDRQSDRQTDRQTAQIIEIFANLIKKIFGRNEV